MIASCRCLKYLPRSLGSVRKNHLRSRFLSRSVKKVTREKRIIKTTVDVILEANEIPRLDTCQKLFCVIDWRRLRSILSERLLVIREVFSLLSIISAIIFVSNSLRIILPALRGRVSRRGKLFSACTWIEVIPRQNASLVLFPRSTNIGIIARTKREANIRSEEKERKMAIVSGTLHL